MKRQLPKLPQEGKYIDILTDWFFKKVFSGASNKRNLIELLNDLLDGKSISAGTDRPEHRKGFLPQIEVYIPGIA